jgi:nicotinamidase-related amidase
MKHAYGISLPETLQEVCNPSSCALLIYDMQVGIVPQIKSGQEILDRCKQILDAARLGGLRIFFTRHFFLPNQIAGTGQLRRAMVWQKKDEPTDTAPFIPYGSAGWEVVSELAPREGEVVVDKITMSAFEGTFLNLAMRDAHLGAFIIVGIALEVGIEPTIRHGLDLNYVPVVVTDACGSKTAQAKDRSLSSLEETGEIITASTSELVALLKAPQPKR